MPWRSRPRVPTITSVNAEIKINHSKETHVSTCSVTSIIKRDKKTCIKIDGPKKLEIKGIEPLAFNML